MEFKDYIYKLDSHSECPICFDMLNNDIVRETPCGHIFHLKCIRSQFDSIHSNRFKCSMCRKDLLDYISDEELSEYNNKGLDIRHIVRMSLRDDNLLWGSDIIEILDTSVNNSMLVNVNPAIRDYEPELQLNYSSSSSSASSYSSADNNSPITNESTYISTLSYLWNRFINSIY